MKGFYILNKEREDKLLYYALEKGPVKEVDANVILEKPVRKACYVKFSKGYLGVIGMNHKCYFFINDLHLDFLDDDWTVSVTHYDDYNVCSVINDGVEILKEKYQKATLDELDPWSDYESEDFYIWLESKKDNKEFIEMWSLER